MLAAARCVDAVRWAKSVGVVRFPQLYEGLNASSPVFGFQLHLYLHDPPSHCSDPRVTGLMVGLESDYGDELYDDIDSAGGTAFTVLLLLGVLLCAVCNAYSLGYLHPNRQLRAVLRAIGCPTETLVR